MDTLTTSQVAAAGGVLGGMMAGMGLFFLAIVIVEIIAMWKLFQKAGEAGWKAIIPLYNVYIFCKIIRVNFWIYIIAIPVGLGLLSALLGSASTFASLLTSFYSIGIEIYLAIMLGRAFNKSTGFKIGLIFLAPIFEMILAFGSSKYALKAPVKKSK